MEPLNDVHAARLADDDVIAVLLRQHTRIRELFARVRAASGEERHELYRELRGLLVVHETAEELVLRPVSEQENGEIARSRNDEEAEATRLLARIDDLGVEDPGFEELLVSLQQAVEQHAEAEENEEFPLIVAACDEDQRRRMGAQLSAAESIAPTRPHPHAAGSTTAQILLGPFAAIADRTRDAIAKVRG